MSSTQMQTRWWWLLIPLGILVAGVAWIRLGNPIPVEAARVQRGPIQKFVLERGKTRLPKVHLVTMPFMGRVEAIDLAEGTPVGEGDIVARVVPYDLALAVRAAAAAVERLEASIQENDDTSVEETGLQQALNFVTSMDRTVEAAAERVIAGSAKYEFAKRNLERITRLRAANAQTEEDLDRAKLQEVEGRVDFQQDRLVHSAMLALQAATALTPTTIRQYIARKALTRAVLEKQKAEAAIALEQAERDQQRGTMRSPIDGVVLERSQSNERVLAAGTVLLRIGDLRQMQLEADVLSHDAVEIRPGQKAEVFGPAIGPQHVPAVVERVYPEGFTKVSSLGVEEQRVKVILRFTPEVLAHLLRDRQLGVDYRVEIRIITAEKEIATVLPRPALFRGEDSRWSVFAVRNGRAQLQNVDLGLMNDQFVEITAGLSEGDVVILAPETNILDGTPVRPVFRDTHL